MKKKKIQKIDTIAAHAGLKPEENHGIVNPPVYHASTILSSSMKDYKDRTGKKYTYGRNGTPTSEALEKAICDLYDADGCVLAPSGMSAITNSFMGVLKSFDHALIPDCVYGSARRFIEEEFQRFQIEYDFYDSRNLSYLESKIKNNTKVIYLESPGSYTFEIIDINKIVKLSKKYKITTIIDNTWGTALYFNALKFGVDIVVEAITKYIGGHSDVMMGVTVCNKKHLNSIIRWKRNSGQCVGPDDVFLALRGLRTLPLRLEKSQKNSITLAKFLSNQKEVKKVYHPALKEHPDHKLWKRDFSGACGIFGIEFEDYVTIKMAEFFADNCFLFGKGASWGGYESLMTMTDVKSNRTINTSFVPKGEYLRIYVGIENIDDILDDVTNSFTKMRKKFK